MGLLDKVKLEKILLARQVGRFLYSEKAAEGDASEKDAVTKAAITLASDKSAAVREVLAYELRQCQSLARELIENIASDIESISVPFLLESPALSDEEMGRLVPKIQDYACAALASRPDLGPVTILAIAENGGQLSVTRLLRNDRITLDGVTVHMVMTRFEEETWMMDQMGVRTDIEPELMDRLKSIMSQTGRLAVVAIHEGRTLEAGSIAQIAAEKAAAQAKPRKIAAPAGLAGENKAPQHIEVTVDNKAVDAIWNRLQGMTSQQVHGIVTDLRANKQLSLAMAASLGERGSNAFLESSFALWSGHPLHHVRDVFTMQNPPEFVQLMKEAGVPKEMAPRFLKLVKTEYANKREGESVAA